MWYLFELLEARLDAVTARSRLRGVDVHTLCQSPAVAQAEVTPRNWPLVSRQVNHRVVIRADGVGGKSKIV